MNNKQKTKINYQKSGVSIDRADKLISSLKSKNINKDKNVLSNIGGFSSLYKIAVSYTHLTLPTIREV